MLLANIVPNGLNQLAERYNDLHLLLVQWAMKDAAYRNFYTSSHKYRILDNGLYEEGVSINIDTLLEYAQKLKVNEVIAPDVMFNFPRTNENMYEFIDACYKKKTAFGGVINGVVCGDSQHELERCYKFYLDMPEVSIISFSRRGCMFEGNRWHDHARERLVECCIKKYNTNHKKIHLLGANGIRDYYIRWPEEVRSIDSKQLATTTLGKWDLNTHVSTMQKVVYKTLLLQTKHNLGVDEVVKCEGKVKGEELRKV
jgi:hypothetical protein